MYTLHCTASLVVKLVLSEHAGTAIEVRHAAADWLARTKVPVSPQASPIFERR